MFQALVLVLVGCQALDFTLQGHSEQCFKLDVKLGTQIRLGFMISGQGDQNVITRLYDPKEKVLYQSPRGHRHGSFETTGEVEGSYKLCFRAMDRPQKVVGFEFSEEEEKQAFATEDELEPLSQGLRKVSRKLDIVYRNLEFYVRKEKTYRDLSELACDKLLWCAVFKILVLVVVTGFQMYFLTGFFNNKQLSSI